VTIIIDNKISESSAVPIVWDTFSGRYGIISIIPFLSCSSRRICDTGRSGFLVLLILIPTIGFLIILILAAFESVDSSAIIESGTTVNGIDDQKKEFNKGKDTKESTRNDRNKANLEKRKNEYYFLKMFPHFTPPELDLLTGGWVPVIQIVGMKGFVCIFSEHSIADAYLKNYSKTTYSEYRSIKIDKMSKSEIKRMNLISQNIIGVALDPCLKHGHFSTQGNYLMKLYEL
jgi:uncharacterized membrane protein YhaH (DUF805 family)